MLIKDKDALANTVQIGFELLTEEVLTRIHRRWLKVLDLIIEDKGNNDMVEKDRSLKSNPMMDVALEADVIDEAMDREEEVHVEEN